MECCCSCGTAAAVPCVTLRYVALRNAENQQLTCDESRTVIIIHSRKSWRWLYESEIWRRFITTRLRPHKITNTAPNKYKCNKYELFLHLCEAYFSQSTKTQLKITILTAPLFTFSAAYLFRFIEAKTRLPVKLKFVQFLPRDATQSAVMQQCIVCPSVRLSVRNI